MSTNSKSLAVVTGGLGDIGSEIAIRLVEDGFRVIALDVGSDEDIRDRAEKINARSSAPITAVKADQRDPAQMQKVLGDLPRLDLVVVSAATVQAQPFLEIDKEAWDRQIDINLTGSFVTAQAAGRIMAESGTRGHILFVSSWVASRPWPEITSYSVSKAGVDQLMRQVALELAPLGIRANAIAPGIVKAGLAKHQLETEPAYAARVATAIPLGELQTATDIANAVSFMASPGASTMTGTVLTVDGGCTLGQIR